MWSDLIKVFDIFAFLVQLQMDSDTDQLPLIRETALLHRNSATIDNNRN